MVVGPEKIEAVPTFITQKTLELRTDFFFAASESSNLRQTQEQQQSEILLKSKFGLSISVYAFISLLSFYLFFLVLLFYYFFLFCFSIILGLVCK